MIIKYLARQFGLCALGVCILCATVEAHQTYRLYVQHENSKFEQIHRAYGEAMAHGAAIERVASVIDNRQLAPPITLQKIAARPHS